MKSKISSVSAERDTYPPVLTVSTKQTKTHTTEIKDFICFGREILIPPQKKTHTLMKSKILSVSAERYLPPYVNSVNKTNQKHTHRTHTKDTKKHTHRRTQTHTHTNTHTHKHNT